MPRSRRIRRGRGFSGLEAWSPMFTPGGFKQAMAPGIARRSQPPPGYPTGGPASPGSGRPASPKPGRPARKRVKCKGSGAGQMFCWDPKVPASGRWYLDTPSPTPDWPSIADPWESFRGLEDMDCRPSGSGRMFCWDDETGSGSFTNSGTKGLQGLGFMEGTSPLIKVGVVAILVIAVAKIV